LTEFLDKTHKEIQARLKELKPLVEEFHVLEAVDRAMSGETNSAPRASTPSTPRRARRTTGGGGGRRGRPRGSGTRGQQALELVRAQPGITIPELAEKMGIKQNYLYRVMPDLASQGQVTKSGRGWHPRG
jgi:hypothetical protein